MAMELGKFAIQAENDQLRAENERLRADNEWLQQVQAKELDQLRAKIENLTEALQRIDQWAQAYPTDIFHEPTRAECNLAHTVLKLQGLSIDMFSAAMGRHCLKGVGEIARNALEQKP